MLTKFYPNAKPVWPERLNEEDLDIDVNILPEAVIDEISAPDTSITSITTTRAESTVQHQKEDVITKEKKESSEINPVRSDRFFSAVDTACAGMLFFRFRNNVSPVDLITKVFGKNHYYYFIILFFQF